MREVRETVDDWELVGTFDSKEKAILKGKEYFTREKSRYVRGRSDLKSFYLVHRCAEHVEFHPDHCCTRVQVRWSKITSFKYEVHVKNSGKCKIGDADVELNDAEEVLDQNGEAAVGVYHKM